MDATHLCIPSHHEHFLCHFVRLAQWTELQAGAGGHAHLSLRLDAPQAVAGQPGWCGRPGWGPPTARSSLCREVPREGIIGSRWLLTF